MGYEINDISQPNGAVTVISTIMHNVMSLTVEAECGALFYNAKKLEELRTTMK